MPGTQGAHRTRMAHRLAASGFVGGFVGALFLTLVHVGCSTTSAAPGAPDAQAPCPADLPAAGSACSPEGSECGYETTTNACGADNCYCQSGAWNCEPTCVIGDGSGVVEDAGDGGPGDASPDPAACVAAGGQCGTAGATACLPVGPPGACGSGPVVSSFCCKVFPDAGSCAPGVDGGILASSYDQSCTTDRDCVAIGQGDSCGLCAFRCPNAAISASALDKYVAEIASTPAGVSGQRPDECGGDCTDDPGPCCVAGECRFGVGAGCSFRGSPDAGSTDASAE